MSIPKNAVPTPLGWVHKKTGELLKSQKMSAAFISEWYGHTAPAARNTPAPVAPMHHNPQTLHEAPSHETELTDAEVDHYYNSQIDPE